MTDIFHVKFTSLTATNCVRNHHIEVHLNGKTVQLALWDTAGQEEYEVAFTTAVVFPIHVILIAFAIDTIDSLENVTVKIYIITGVLVERRSAVHLWSYSPRILVGCKADLRPPSDDPNIDRYVSREQAERVAQSIRARAYKECSALKMEGVDDVFEAATRAGILMREGVSAGTHARRRTVFLAIVTQMGEVLRHLLESGGRRRDA
ncbi:ras family-domain-containing protein [Russula vinacea]|nr:ras family-domain-containing protein [Russula vinacea]